jgi:hypothetical protein
LCDVFLFCARFPLTKLLTKIGFFVTRKGPHTRVIVYSGFVKERIDSEKAGELRYIFSYRMLKMDNN